MRLLACGVPSADAELAAKQMIEADLTGFDAHGIFRLSAYCRTLQIRPGQSEGQHQGAAALARDRAGRRRRRHRPSGDDLRHQSRHRVGAASGVGWVGARNSNHAGAAGIYAEMPVAHGMVGIYAAVSTINNMAPWGGGEALLGTNPIAVGIPAGKEAPILLDIATSVSSFGNIRQYIIRNEPLPEGWVVHSKTGQPITDPKQVSEGVLLPIGGHKGSGLALVIGLLGGILNGAAFGREVVDFMGPGSNPTNTGQFVIALDIKRFIPPEVFAAEMDRHLNDLRSSARLPGFDAIRLPGEDRPQAPRRAQHRTACRCRRR